ncbi:histidine phosphatase superfamily [Dichomitus squalens]|uniref:Histidine phosphatase superfamily n=1 Tax=Dichomitus squalens TaxID=114155 RepID=A0A4Q9QCX0_9APHY|nr:histidine phosphatase superfamily [Dichomitus squalens]
MAIDRIYLARHGYRMNWVTEDWVSVTGTARDPPLAPYGLSQAKELADFFISLPEEERPTIVLSSPYHRCLQTAQPTAEALKLPIYVEHGLSEWYSPAAPGTGLYPRPGQATDLRTHVPEISDDWQSIFYPTRKGEDAPEMHDRSHDLLRALIPAVEHKYGGKHQRILLVSHAAPIIGLVRVLVDNRALPLRVGTCSITDLRPRDTLSNAVGNWEAIKLADSSHLEEGALRDWGFEDAVYIDGKVINHHGEPGTENEKDEPVGLQVHLLPPGFQA